MLEKYEIVRDMFHGFDYRAGLDRHAAGAACRPRRRDRVGARHAAARGREGERPRKARSGRTAASTTPCWRCPRPSPWPRPATRRGKSATRSGSSRRSAPRWPRARRAPARHPPSGTSPSSRSSAAPSSRPRSSTFSKAAGHRDAGHLHPLRRVPRRGPGDGEEEPRAWRRCASCINGEIRSQSRVNVVQTRAFSERLEEAIARYHTNAITTAEVIQELIELAKDIRAARQRGEEEGPQPGGDRLL